jgi:inositol transport system permease protein
VIEAEKNTTRRESPVLAFISKYSILLIFVGLAVVIAILSGGVFLRINNLLNVLRQISVIGIIALGVTMCIITADRPVLGGVVAIVSVAVASLVQSSDAMDGFSPVKPGRWLFASQARPWDSQFLNGAMISS